MKLLPPSQYRVLRFVARSLQQRGYPPTIVETSTYMGYSAKRSAEQIINRLIALGFLTRDGHMGRAIALTEAGKWVLIFPHAFVQGKKR